MKVPGDFLDVIGLKERTTGSNVKDVVVKCAEDHGLDLKNLIGIATDGAPSMVERNAGAVTLILSHIDSLKEGSSATDEMFVCHCFLHLENLCAQVLDMSHVMKVVVTTVNVIKHNALKHLQFQQYLIELESEYGDLLYYGKVRWLSRGRCLKRFWNLKEEVGNFMTENGSLVPQLEDGKCLLDLCFLVDITTKLNELNKKLQGKDKPITDCYEDIQAFITKFKLYEGQLASKNAYHFPLLNTFNCEDKDVTKYSAETEKLLRAFSERFEYLKKYEKSFRIFACPFDFVPEDAPEYLQLELIDLQVNTERKSLFYTTDKLQFYRDHVPESEFPNLKRLALRIAAAMGTTFACESFFSRLKIVKSKSRSRLTDTNMMNELRCAVTNLPIVINKLSSDIQKQTSH